MTTTEASALASRAHGGDAAKLAASLSISREAVELVWGSEVLDLHIESFIPPRLWGYDLHQRHSHRVPLNGYLFGHLDFPRAIEGGLTGGMWSIATNITRASKGRSRHLETNARALAASIERHPQMRVVRSHTEWQAARQQGLHGALVCVQGGNAFEGRDYINPDGLLTRVTVVHLSNSIFGDTSSPLRASADRGLTDRGREFIGWLNHERIFVDLAHAGTKTFWGAVEAHDRTQPLIVTHTGSKSVHDMWRNVDDAQVKAVADSGGVLGVIFHSAFLGGRVRDGRVICDHLEAFMRAGGEGCAALGTDYDGFIIPPPELRDGATAYYRLVDYMLQRKWSEARIRGILGANFLRSFAALRP